MKHLRIALFALAGTAAFAGCADDPVRPDMEAARFSRSAAGEGTGNHLVLFKALAVPAGFADRVAALGGKVEQAQAVLGEAIVSGLNASGIAALRADDAVGMVEPETVLQIPRVWRAAPAAVAAAVPASQANPATAFFYPRQWHLRAIHSDQAWAAGALGDPAITVAILDTGIGYTPLTWPGWSTCRVRSRSCPRMMRWSWRTSGARWPICTITAPSPPPCPAKPWQRAGVTSHYPDRREGVWRQQRLLLPPSSTGWCGQSSTGATSST
jgi:hypothetical protein